MSFLRHTRWIGLATVTLMLGCGGSSCLFGPTCDTSTFVSNCTTKGSFETCNYNSWSGRGHVRTSTCDSSEFCLLGEGAVPTCVLGPPMQTCPVDGERRCEGQDLQDCTFHDPRGPSGETLWRHERTCKEGWSCTEVGTRAGCALEPVQACQWDPSARYRCVGSQPQRCEGIVGPRGAPKAHFWNLVLSECGSDEQCLTDGANVSCVVSPPETCEGRVKETRCVGGRKQRCGAGGDGMMGPPTPHWTWTSSRCSASTEP